MQSTCIVCKKIFKNKNKYIRKTCSKKCNYILVAEKSKSRAKPKLKKTCVICNSFFEVEFWRDRKTCSRKCQGELSSQILTGVPKTEEHKRNLSKAMKLSEANKKTRFRKGKENPAYGRDQKGEKNPNWKGGTTHTNQKKRNDPRLNEWRIKVFERDNYTCQKCGAKGYLQAHHIIHFSKDYSKAFDLDNGVTLCVDCHEKEHGRKIGKFKQKK